MSSQEAAANKYKFGPRDKRGLILGISISQVFTFAFSLVVFVFLIRSGAHVYEIVLGTILCLLIFITTFVNIQTRPIQSWIPLLIMHKQEKLSYRFWHKRAKIVVDGKRNYPKPLKRLEIISMNFQKNSMGLIKDNQRSTVTAVISMESLPFALLGDADRDRSISAWSQVLSAIAYETSSIKKLQWIEQTLPDSGEYLDGHNGLFDKDNPVIFQDSCGASETQTAKLSYQELLAVQTRNIFRHGIFLACTFSRRIDSNALKAEIVNLLIRCKEIGLGNVSVLSLEDINLYLRHVFDVSASSGPVTWPWPHSIQENWSYLRIDALYVATYSIIEWPRSEVKAGFFLPLMIGCDIRRSISLVMQPIGALRAAKQVEQAKTEHAADSAIKNRYGFSSTARAKKEAEAIERREQELAAGFAGYRFAGYISVYAQDENELSNSCKQIEQLASLSLIDIRRAYGEQREAFLCTLPLGRGCD